MRLIERLSTAKLNPKVNARGRPAQKKINRSFFASSSKTAKTIQNVLDECIKAKKKGERRTVEEVAKVLKAKRYSYATGYPLISTLNVLPMWNVPSASLATPVTTPSTNAHVWTSENTSFLLDTQTVRYWMKKCEEAGESHEQTQPGDSSNECPDSDKNFVYVDMGDFGCFRDDLLARS